MKRQRSQAPAGAFFVGQVAAAGGGEVAALFAAFADGPGPPRRDPPGQWALLDLDHFKRFDDQLRPPRRATSSLRDRRPGRPLLRTSDLLARYGGEEFAVLLPTSTLGQARRGRRSAPVGHPAGPDVLGRGGVVAWRRDLRPARRRAPTRPCTGPSGPAATRCSRPPPLGIQAGSIRTPLGWHG